MKKRTNYHFPRLPILDGLTTKLLQLDKENITQTAIFSVQHILESTGSLIEKLMESGFKPAQLFFTGKYYSTSKKIERCIVETGINYFSFQEKISINKSFSNAMTIHINKFWNFFLNSDTSQFHNIIILDEGGYCLESIPGDVLRKFNVIGIEQTAGGIYKSSTFRASVIDVARSVAKRKLEAPLISKTIIEKIQSTLNRFNNPNIGIIGFGALGKAIYQHLEKRYANILVSDISPIKLKNCSDAVPKIALLNQSDVILGCTGRSCLNLGMLNGIKGVKVLISCSSADIEFLSLIQAFNREHQSRYNPLEDLHFSLSELDLVIIGGGYPINFDRSKVSVPNTEIQLTRGLLIVAIFQALKVFESGHKVFGNRIIPLDSNLQRVVANLWFQNYPSYLNKVSETQLSNFQSLSWIKSNSENLPDIQN